MEPKQTHVALQPLQFLIGRWQSISANGKYLPRVKPFVYCEELEFTSLGQPLLNYKATSWHAVDKYPMHLETGFLKIRPGTREVSMLLAHNFGLTTIEEGNVDEDNCIRLKSIEIGRASSGVEPAVTQTERLIRLNDRGQLEVISYMATSLNPVLMEHLAVIYERC